MAVINTFRGEHRFLSNFYQSPVTFEGLTYATAEAAFQAQKAADPAQRLKYTEIKNPVRAKQMGKKETLPPDWDAAAYDIMAAILRRKFADPGLAARLQATGDALLVEGNHWHDNRWGCCSCEKCGGKVGENRLGRILMDIRAQLNAG